MQGTLDDRAQVDRFFTECPDSVVLINDKSIDDVFAGNESPWQSRTLRTLLVSNTSYVVVHAPAGN